MMHELAVRNRSLRAERLLLHGEIDERALRAACDPDRDGRDARREHPEERHRAHGASGAMISAAR
jgi:hypothetical protein